MRPAHTLTCPRRAGDLSQGGVLRHYVSRMRELLFQLREVAVHTAKARAVGIVSEAEAGEAPHPVLLLL